MILMRHCAAEHVEKLKEKKCWIVGHDMMLGVYQGSKVKHVMRRDLPIAHFDQRHTFLLRSPIG